MNLLLATKGKVLLVGGIKEEISPELREGMIFVYAKTVSDVLDYALEPLVTRIPVMSGGGGNDATPFAPVTLDAPIGENLPMSPTATAKGA